MLDARRVAMYSHVLNQWGASFDVELGHRFKMIQKYKFSVQWSDVTSKQQNDKMSGSAHLFNTESNVVVASNTRECLF
jgi:hypothetical protein